MSGLNERVFTKWAVFVIVRNEQGEVLLQQRARDAKYLNGYWDLPSGHGEHNEDIRVTAVRELKEEVGLDGRPEDLRLVQIDQYFVEDNYINFVFALDIWNGTPKVCEPDKCDGVAWFAPDKLPEKCVNVVRAVEAAGFTDGLTYSITDKDTFYNLMGFPR
ncbi:MAG TPA: NUDIX domain-containing protein [Candidatus Saccharimonadales bacterium]|jgi:8-oxo-dGTP pyrophosphatase MutT (NUDIX family)